jgi:peroxiredoxin
MKKSLYLVFVLFTVVVISCANKDAENANENSANPLTAKVTALLTKNFNSIIEAPNAQPPELTADDKGKSGAFIKGVVEGTPARAVYLHEITKTRLLVVDSALIDDKGNFAINTSKFTEPTLCFLTLNSPNPPGIPVVVGSNTKLSMAIKNGGWISFTVSGDPNNQLMNELYTIYMNHDKNLQDFNREIENIDPTMVTDSLRIAVSTRFQTMQKKRTDDIAGFVSGRAGSPASYYAVTFLFQEPSIALMQIAYDKMKSSIPNSKYTLELKESIESIAPLEVGGLAPDINLQGTDGKSIKLSSLRGKVVLIDFWASWCGPCRRENPNVVRLYNAYKSKGFEIYGVSLDDNKDKWQNAITHDGLTWKHVSDLKGWSSAAAQAYQVSSIPFTVLLDKNGRIIAKGLRGEELEQKLSEILK